MVTEDIAGFFLDGWYVFDNFAPFQIEWRDNFYPTSEHAYQAAHFIEISTEISETIRQAKSPREAADFANANAQYEDPDWKDKKLTFMQEIVRCKLEQHDYIRQVLIASGEKRIVEMNDKDEFWGWGKNHDGRNELGKIWMQLRNEIKA